MSLLDLMFEDNDISLVEPKIDKLVRETKDSEILAKEALRELWRTNYFLNKSIRRNSEESFKNFSSLTALKCYWMCHKILELKSGKEWEYHSESEKSIELFGKYLERIVQFIQGNINELTKKDMEYILDVAEISEYINIDSMFDGSFDLSKAVSKIHDEFSQ